MTCKKKKERRGQRAKTQNSNTPPELKIELNLRGLIELLKVFKSTFSFLIQQVEGTVEE